MEKQLKDFLTKAIKDEEKDLFEYHKDNTPYKKRREVIDWFSDIEFSDFEDATYMLGIIDGYKAVLNFLNKLK